MSAVSRIEIAIEPGVGVTGAQITDGGKVVGLDTGNNPEYSQLLDGVLGAALAEALANIITLTAQNEALTAERDRLDAELKKARKAV